MFMTFYRSRLQKSKAPFAKGFPFVLILRVSIINGLRSETLNPQS